MSTDPPNRLATANWEWLIDYVKQHFGPNAAVLLECEFPSHSPDLAPDLVLTSEERAILLEFTDDFERAVRDDECAPFFNHETRDGIADLLRKVLRIVHRRELP